MSSITIFLLAIGLAMDAFVVSLTNGLLIKNLKIYHALIFGLFFGFFQFLMPVIGFFAGTTCISYISKYDHYIVFFLLSAIGGKMFFDSFKEDDTKDVRSNKDILCFSNITILAIATSIDALAVGISFSVTNTDILFASIIIGIVAFLLSTCGVFIGKKINGFFKENAERFGGIILFTIGLKIVIEHLFIQ